jgi:DNA topoisomerase-2
MELILILLVEDAADVRARGCQVDLCFFPEQLKEENAADDDSDVDSDLEEDAKDADYDYLLGMAMWSLTAEKKEELLKKKDDKHKELDQVISSVNHIVISLIFFAEKKLIWRKYLVILTTKHINYTN